MISAYHWRRKSLASRAFPAVLSIVLLASGTPVSSAGDKADAGTPANIIIAMPNGGQVVAPRDAYTIRWFARGIDTVRIEYSLDGGRTWLLISDAVPAATEENYHCPEPLLKDFMPSDMTNSMGSFAWNVPDTESGEVLIRILDKLQPSIADVSDRPFTISQRTSSGWTMQSVGAAVTLWSVSIVDDSVAWTCAWDSVVFRTTNGGSSWTPGATLPTHGTSIFGWNADTAFVCVNFTDDGRIYRTTNGGNSWTLVFQYTGASAYMNSVHMFDAKEGVAIGDPVGGRWKILQTTNSGLTWDSLSQIPQSQHGFRTAVAWNGDLQGWVGTDGGLVYHATDGGLTWSPSDLGSMDVFGLAIPSETVGMASTAFRYIYRTTNGGASWSYTSTVPGTPMNIISFIAGVTVPTPRWWATNMDEIYRSTNHGTTWTYETLANGYPFNDIAMKYIPEKGLVVGYAVAAADGVVMKYVETVTSVPEEPPPLPLTAELLQNYPNPFNPISNIQFRIAQGGMVELAVFDLLGRQVAALVNEPRTPGVYTVQWDASGVGSGVYFYRLRTGSVMQTRKMAVLQ